MRRHISNWLVTIVGAALLLGGAGAMFFGWDTIQVERGWSLFIAGAAMLSGGAIVLALGEALVRLDALLAWSAPPIAEPESTPSSSDSPQEIDRYDVDGTTYVMFSDGGVEVRAADGVRRYASLAELRAQSARRG